MSETVLHRDALYLFVCHLEWRNRRNLAAYQELLAALDDRDDDIRRLAESLLHPKLTQACENWEGSRSLVSSDRAPLLKMSGKLFAVLSKGAQWQRWR